MRKSVNAFAQWSWYGLKTKGFEGGKEGVGQARAGMICTILTPERVFFGALEPAQCRTVFDGP